MKSFGRIGKLKILSVQCLKSQPFICLFLWFQPLILLEWIRNCHLYFSFFLRMDQPMYFRIKALTWAHLPRKFSLLWERCREYWRSLHRAFSQMLWGTWLFSLYALYSLLWTLETMASFLYIQSRILIRRNIFFSIILQLFFSGIIFCI